MQADPNFDYPSYQKREDARYLAAWENAPESFKRQAKQAGIAPQTENHSGMAMEFNENFASSAITPDIAGEIDDYLDAIIEKHGSQHEALIRAVAKDLKGPMEIEIERGRAMMLGRIAGYLIKSETKNVLARVHQLLHAIPRLAACSGFPSMRKSAKACGVSVEWIRRGRDKWCDILGLPIPEEGKKSLEAKAKYHENGLANHWRHKKGFLTETNKP